MVSNMYKPKMSLTPEQTKILSGSEGETKAKMMETIVRFGDMFEAERLIPVTHKEGHLVTSFGLNMLTPIYPLMDKVINAGIKAPAGFTVDPRPLDYKNVHANPIEKLVFSYFMYGQQAHYEEQLRKIGLIDKDAFTCTAYLPEIGNTPHKGDVLSWSESSAVVFANSALGARCNRNSGVIDMFGSILGFVPEFGLLTDQGRKATWKIIIKTTKLPEAQILGSAIGLKVVEAVPYVEGLSQWLKAMPDDDTLAYLKDFGAATASNGAVGLYHIEGVTPEACEKGQAILSEGAKEYIIDDAEIERVYASYPVMWDNPSKRANTCFIGCPHLTIKQLESWTDNMTERLAASHRRNVVMNVVFTAAPQVADEFKKGPKYKQFLATGAHLSSICPLMYTNNPLTKKHRIMTTSNKLRTYSRARYYKDEDALRIICGQEAK
jgi:predicted aconitase